MEDNQTPICIPLPKPKPLKIRLPFGDLNSVVDISKGPPTDCTLIHGLMLQLSPALVGMECFLNLLNFVQILSQIKGPQDLVKIADATAKVAGCFVVFGKIPLMIVDILKLIIAYLKCIIESIRSILAFQVGINLGDAEGNPAVSLSLNCAQNNAAASTAQLRQALGAIQPLLKLLEPIKALATVPLPDPAQKALNIIPEVVAILDPILAGGGATVGVPGTQDVIQTLDEVDSTLNELEEALDAISS